MPHNLHFDFLAPYYDQVIRAGDVQIYMEALHLPVPGNLLDVGGGTGRITQILQDHVSNILLCDLSFPMLCQARLKGLTWSVLGSVQALPFRRGTILRILVVDALHHFEDQRESVRNLLDTLAPGGILLIEEPDISRLPVKLIALLEKLALMDSHMHTAEDIRRMGDVPGVTSRIFRKEKNAVWITMEKSVQV
jgi:ubiquinone/menaquinone biosynthesis C-methylase UbiE